MQLTAAILQTAIIHSLIQCFDFSFGTIKRSDCRSETPLLPETASTILQQCSAFITNNKNGIEAIAAVRLTPDSELVFRNRVDQPSDVLFTAAWQSIKGGGSHQLKRTILTFEPEVLP